MKGLNANRLAAAEVTGWRWASSVVSALVGASRSTLVALRGARRAPC
jgi:hypothetical protein